MLLQLVKICECVQVCVGMHADIALESAKTYFLAPHFYFFYCAITIEAILILRMNKKIFVIADIISA